MLLLLSQRKDYDLTTIVMIYQKYLEIETCISAPQCSVLKMSKCTQCRLKSKIKYKTKLRYKLGNDLTIHK